MGQQQLLLIVVGVVIVGLAVVLGFSMFQDAGQAGKVDGAISYTQNMGRQCASSLQRGEAFGGYNSIGSWVTAHPSGSTAIGTYQTSAEPDSTLRTSWLIDGNTYTIDVDVANGEISSSPGN